MKNTRRSLTESRLSKIWLYTKFQLLTKGLLGLVVLPTYTFIIGFLLRSSGKFHISSGDYIDFLFSSRGLFTLLITLLLLSIMVALDLNTFIISSALIREGRMGTSSREVIIRGLGRIKNFFKPSGLFILLYIALVVPLVGIGLTISATKDFQIPNFITDVIFNNPLYTALYTSALAVLTLTSFIYIFTFHYIVLFEKNTRESLRLARRLMMRHKKRFIKDFVLFFFLYSLLAAVITIALFFALFFFTEFIVTSATIKRMSTAFVLLLFAEIISFLTFLSVPLITSRLTTLFYRYNEMDGIEILYYRRFETKSLAEKKESTKPIAKKRAPFLSPKTSLTILTAAVLLFNLGASAIIGLFFEPLFLNYSHKDIIAHRGGGDLDAENTLAGLEKAIASGANCSEIDVQRTADGIYIIYHDSAFSRLSGISKKPDEMRYEDIRNLRVKNLFRPGGESREIATLEEFMSASKGRIKLFIELKGRSADTKMVDDVVRMIRDREMEDETAILSLDYHLIEYTEKKYPEITTGYLYFFQIGNIEKMAGDMLIMEEREATPEKIDKIHKAGKKAIVWTVNKEESVAKFVRSDVDGIITDYVLRVRRGIEERDKRTDYQILIDAFFGE